VRILDEKISICHFSWDFPLETLNKFCMIFVAELLQSPDSVNIVTDGKVKLEVSVEKESDDRVTVAEDASVGVSDEKN